MSDGGGLIPDGQKPLPKSRRTLGRKRLTVRQEKFARAIANNEASSLSEAWSIAAQLPKGKMTEQGGSRNYLKPHVQARIEELRQRYTTEGLEDPLAIRRFVLGGLHELATYSKVDTVKARCLELLGKVSTVGLFVDRKEVVTRGGNEPDLQMELAGRLRSLLGPVPDDWQSAAPTITVEALPSLPEPQQVVVEAEPSDVPRLSTSEQSTP